MTHHAIQARSQGRYALNVKAEHPPSPATRNQMKQPHQMHTQHQEQAC